MNAIDLIYILLFFTALTVGFFQGMIRLVVVIGAFYLSTVLASLYYASLGEVFVRELGAQRLIAQYVAFALVLFFGFFALTAAGIYTFRYAQLPSQLEFLDRSIGTLLGMVLGALVLGILGVLLWNMLIVRGGSTIGYPILRWMGESVGSSSILRFFATSILPQIYDVIAPFLPGSARLIFVVQ